MGYDFQGQNMLRGNIANNGLIKWNMLSDIQKLNVLEFLGLLWAPYPGPDARILIRLPLLPISILSFIEMALS